MPDVNLKLLQTFILVAENESFRQAAAASNRTPSAISMQIRDLENQIGMRLFNRTPQKVSLTADGRALYTETSQGMKQIMTGLDRLSDQVTKRKGKVTMACAPTLASNRLGDILSSFRRKFPESILQLREAAPAAALEMIERQKVEFYFGPEPSSQTDVAFEALFYDPIFACIPPEFDHGQSGMSLAELGAFPVLMLDKKTALRTVIDTLLKEQGLSLNIRCELQSAHSSLSLASCGLGIAILPSIALVMGDTHGFRPVPITDPMACRGIGLITARGYIQHNYTEQLLQLIRDGFREPAETGI